jgi:hypothetical protein
MSGHGLDADLNEPSEDIFVRVGMTPHKNSGRPSFLAVGAAVKIVQAGDCVPGCRADLGESKTAPLRVPERSKVPKRALHFARQSDRNGAEPATGFRRRLNFLEFLPVRAWHKRNHRHEPNQRLHVPSVFHCASRLVARGNCPCAPQGKNRHSGRRGLARTFHDEPLRREPRTGAVERSPALQCWEFAPLLNQPRRGGAAVRGDAAYSDIECGKK